MVNFKDEEERKGRTKPGRLFGIVLAVMLAQIAAMLAGCASFVPSHVEDTAFERHAVSKEKSNVRVTVAVLTARESQDYFGVPLESKEIQAVWLRVENRNDYNLYIVPRSTDPNYYSAYEAAYVNHRPFARRSNEGMDQFFQRSRIKLRVPANQTNTGSLSPISAKAPSSSISKWSTTWALSATVFSSNCPTTPLTTRNLALIRARCRGVEREPMRSPRRATLGSEFDRHRRCGPRRTLQRRKSLLETSLHRS